MRSRYDAVVVGAGPNGLAAAIRMAQAGRSVLVIEANDEIGGGARTEDLTLPGFHHDACSSVYPMGVGSPFFASLPLHDHGLEWVHPPTLLAHPFDDGTAAVLSRSIAETADGMGDEGGAYRKLLEPLVERWDDLSRGILDPLSIPRNPLLMLRFARHALRSAEAVAKDDLRGGRGAALFAGSAAHCSLPLNLAGTAAYGLVLHMAAHAVGWPFAKGGAGRITAALASYLKSLGGEIRTGQRVKSLRELPAAGAVFLNLTPRQVLDVAGDQLRSGYRGQLERFRYGPGTFKVDWAMSGPVPWTSDACHHAGTVHLAGTLDEVLESERYPFRGAAPKRPFVLFSQPSVFDPSRAPDGMHTAWAYCHLPNGSTVDMTERIERQVERFAPGFGDLVIAKHVLTPGDLEQSNANLVGGDVNGGAGSLAQLIFRPTLRLNPYSTPIPGVFICSASTPPGGGVHGMCGFNAAAAALRETH
jgi:phytoene dehydrogenase-like protein